MQRIYNVFRGLMMPAAANQSAGSRSLKGFGIVGIGLLGLFLIVVGCAEDGSGIRYVCTNGTAAAGTASADGVERCARCKSTYKLTNNRCDQRTQYTCANGTKQDGMPAGNKDVESCTACTNGYSLISSVCVRNVTLSLDTTSDTLTTSAAFITPSLDDANAYRIEIIDKRGSGTLSMKAQTSGGVDVSEDRLTAPSTLTSGDGVKLFPTGQRLFLPASDASYKLVATASGNVRYKVRMSVYAQSFTFNTRGTTYTHTIRRGALNSGTFLGEARFSVALIPSPTKLTFTISSSYPTNNTEDVVQVRVYDSDDFGSLQLGSNNPIVTLSRTLSNATTFTTPNALTSSRVVFIFTDPATSSGYSPREAVSVVAVQ